MKKFYILAIFVSMLMLFGSVYATEITSNVTFTNPLKATSLYCFVSDILGVVVRIGISIAVLMFVYTGFVFVTAGGDESKLKKAKDMFLWTVIGTAVLLGSWAIAVVVENTINKIRYGENPPASASITSTTCK